MIERPNSSEYASFYANYVNKVPFGDVLQTLEILMNETQVIFEKVNEEQSKFKYAEGKWSINELLGHIIDTEWIFSNRALRFARNDSTELPGFEQDDYIKSAAFDKIGLHDLTLQFYHLRKANLFLFNTFSETELNRIGVANKNKISVKALIYITAGHHKHHLEVLKEKYLPNL